MKVRSHRRFALAALALALAGLAVPAAWLNYRRSLGPLDLSAPRHGSAVVVDRNGRLLRAFTTNEGRWRLPALRAEVDPRFIAMLIAYEDQRFTEHHGVDVLALHRAAAQWIGHGRIVSGGSTLTMQVARLLEPREERSLGAKLGQIVRAVEIEQRVGKAGVIDLYLSLAPYGGNLEGIRAASLAYFGKEPKRLSISEAALLVALPQSPETRRPDRFPGAARAARNLVLDRVRAHGLISAAECELAKLDAVSTLRRAFPTLAPHASEAAIRRAPGQQIHRLTLDARLQASFETLAKESAQRVGPKLSAAILAIDNASGEVLAHVGSADYFSQEGAGSIDMTAAIRSPGSTLKPFIYALAFETGAAHPETLLDDRPTHYGAYAPQDFDLSFQGAVTARKALQLSLNLPAIELLAEIGPARLLARLRNAGAAIALSDEAAPGLAVGLGGLGVKLRDLAALYAGLARGGSVPALIELQSDAALPKPEPRRISEPVASWYVADILRGAAPPLNAPAGQIAYKTGTSYGYRDAFAIGFDKAHTIAVWIGRPDNGAVPGLVGRQVAAPVLFDAFARLGGGHDFPPPPANVLISRTSALPPPLRRFSANAAGNARGSVGAPLKIVFPPDGARVDLGLSRPASGDARLALKAEGGVPPLTWIVNGAPLGQPDPRRQTSWIPDGAGFARVSIIDAAGATDSVLVRLE
ncbi:penicillin-binding protein 1C [Methylocapsa palsarum]|nr:penicillin-binding protein 1C [Methylocapsa palsarum]